jgi:hypothetical protein
LFCDSLVGASGQENEMQKGTYPENIFLPQFSCPHQPCYDSWSLSVMKSPFPGMDPYLEQKWGEVHTSLIVYARNQLNSQLPDDLQATIVQYVAEPLVLPMVPRTERHVSIVDSEGKVITAMEFLSPWNKVGVKGQEKYARKQANYLAADVNLVEIDLVRQGSYVLTAPDEMIPEHLRTSYLVCVYRKEKPDQVEVFRVPLRERLPNIPIPLRPGEPDAVLQLQPLIDDCYRDGRHHRTNYRVDPNPPLIKEDADWADTLLREQGYRT